MKFKVGAGFNLFKYKSDCTFENIFNNITRVYEIYEDTYRSDLDFTEEEPLEENTAHKIKVAAAQLIAENCCFPLPTQKTFFGLFYKKNPYDRNRLWFPAEIENTNIACRNACYTLWKVNTPKMFSSRFVYGDSLPCEEIVMNETTDLYYPRCSKF